MNWEIAGVLVAALSILVAILIYWWQRQVKKLSYGILVLPLLNIDKKLKDKLEIHYDGEMVTGLNQIVIRLENTGKLPIEVRDYEKPIKLVPELDENVE
jgi:hypothetical protein